MLFFLMVLVAQADDVYRVSSPGEFFQAIGSDRTIVVEQGAKILLCSLQEFPESEPWNYLVWDHGYDGSSPVIQNVENLVIRGEGYRESSLVVEPRYVFVLDLRDCNGVTIENLVLGHTTGGYCMSGVLGIHNCSGVSVTGSMLYGCGTEGLTIQNSGDVSISGTDVVECTYGVMTCDDSRDIHFTNCVFRENGQYYGAQFHGCSGVRFSGCVFSNCRCGSTEGFLKNASSCDMIIENCFFQHIVCPSLFAGGNFVLQENMFLDVEENGE